jgi:hypothetical protein
MFVYSEKELEKIIYALTLQDRHKKRHKWLLKGFEKINSRPNSLLNYWKNRLSKNNAKDIQMYNEVLTRYNKYKKASPGETLTPEIELERLISHKKIVDEWVEFGERIATEKEIDFRKKICQGCKYWDSQALKGNGKCKKCGCPTLAKIRLANESCPEGYWKSIKDGMLIVIPVSRHDSKLIEDFCDIVSLFSPYKKHNLLVVSRPSDKGYADIVFERLNSCFKESSIHIFADEGPHGWPHGPNFYWYQTIVYLKSINNPLPWFWMELDVTPIQEGWIDSLEEEYKNLGKPCLGVIQRADNILTHLAGTAIYPPNIDLICDSWKSVIETDIAFDMWCSAELVPLCAESKLIQHNFRTEDYRCTNLGMKGIDKNFRPNGDRFDNVIRPETAVVHGCNDGSLARLLLNKVKIDKNESDNEELAILDKTKIKIYTYQENINDKDQCKIIDLWKKSWERQGFEAVVLNKSHAEAHPYYQEFIKNLEKLHLKIMEKPISNAGLDSYLRWLAFSIQEEELFYVSDYDLINNKFKKALPIDKLHFMDADCPRLASGTPKQFKDLCYAFIKVTQQRAEALSGNVKPHYHDQQFLTYNFMPNLSPASDRFIEQYNVKMTRDKTRIADKFNENIKVFELIHFSYSFCKKYNPNMSKIEIVKRICQEKLDL